MQNRALILILLAIGSVEAGLFARFSGLSRSLIPKVAAPIAGYWAGVKSLKAEDAAKKPEYPHWRFRNSPGVQATHAMIPLAHCLGRHREHLSAEDKKRYNDAFELAQKIVRIECSSPASEACQALATEAADATTPKMTYFQEKVAAEEGIQVVHELYQKQWDEKHLKKRFDTFMPLNFNLDEAVERYSSYGDPYFDPQYEHSAGVRAYKAIPKLFPYFYNYDAEISDEDGARYVEAIAFLRRIAGRDCVESAKKNQCIKALKYGIDETSSRAHNLESAKQLAEEAVKEARSLRYTVPGAIVTAQQAIKTITGK